MRIDFNFSAMTFLATDTETGITLQGDIVPESPKRWFSRDPKETSFPGMSPYNSMGANPVMMVDPDGEVIMIAEVADRQGESEHESTNPNMNQEYHGYRLTPMLTDGILIGWEAWRITQDSESGEEIATRHYVLTEPGDAKIFRQNVEKYKKAADLLYSNGPLSESMVDILSGNYFSGLSEEWAAAATNPFFWMEVACSFLSLPTQSNSWKGVMRNAEMTSNNIGKYGEQLLNQSNKGIAQKMFLRSPKGTKGSRIVDLYDPVNKIAHEAKVGRVSLSTTIKTQIHKDIRLKIEVGIKEVVWHFYPSPKTGLAGPTKALREVLEQSGIKIIQHY